MKVRNRSVPNDMLAFDHDDCRVLVSTHRQSINIAVEKNGKAIHVQTMTPEQFISFLMRDTEPQPTHP